MNVSICLWLHSLSYFYICCMRKIIRGIPDTTKFPLISCAIFYYKKVSQFYDSECDDRCYHHGECQNNKTCKCLPGWNGKFCTISGCPNNCFARYNIHLLGLPYPLFTTRKYPICGYILGVLTHTATDWHWGGDETSGF